MRSSAFALALMRKDLLSAWRWPWPWLVIALAVAHIILYPPAMADSLSYRLPRMFLALQGDGMGHFNTPDFRMNAMPWGWELLALPFASINALGLCRLINLAVWVKSNGGMGSLLRSQHELVLITKKGKAPHINNVELGKHGRYRTNVWRYPGVNSFGKNRMEQLGAHPTPKPVAMVADAIRDVSHRGQIVLDSFMGSGTTLLAAERTSRIAYGMDLDPGYVDLTIRRWEKMTGQTARLAATGQTLVELAAERLAATPIE